MELTSGKQKSNGLMKLEEAAKILGLDTDCTLEQIKTAYKNMAVTVYPTNPGAESDPTSAPKLHSLSIAFTRMTTKLMLNDNDEADDDSNSEEDIEEEDVHEMRAFMRMFMDLVGIFNEDRQFFTPEPHGFQIPPKLAKLIENWSSDEDDIEDDEDSDVDGDSEDSSDDENGKSCKSSVETDADLKKKLKNQKKRAEKRRKLKEKKQSRGSSEEGGSKSDGPSAAEKELALRNELFASTARGDYKTLESILNLPESVFTASERECLHDGRAGNSLLLCCVTNLSHTADKNYQQLSSGRIKIATHLLRKNPPADVAVLDEESRSVVHLSAEMNDAPLIALLVAERDAKRISFDINSVCIKSGWTALHYAAEKGNHAACRALLNGGASLSMQALIFNSKDGSAKSKGPTPLDMAKQRLKKPHSPSHAAGLDAVCAELTRAIEEEGKAKSELEQSKKKRESVAAAAEKEKQRERQAAVDKEIAEKIEIAANEEEKAGSKASEEKSSKRKKKKNGKKDVSEGVTPAAMMTEATVPNSVASLAIASAQISRDELLDQLLGMGFAEADCMAAITACGNNADSAISWLCERPAPPAVKASSSKLSTNSKQAQSNLKVISSESKDAAQKEKDRSEELRRINRAWNMKNEIELKKQQQLEQEKKMKESRHLPRPLMDQDRFSIPQKMRQSVEQYQSSPNFAPVPSPLVPGYKPSFESLPASHNFSTFGSSPHAFNSLDQMNQRVRNDTRPPGFGDVLPMESFNNSDQTFGGINALMCSMDQRSSEITNALELSAGAREFIPHVLSPMIGQSDRNHPPGFYDARDPFMMTSSTTTWTALADFRKASPDTDLGLPLNGSHWNAPGLGQDEGFQPASFSRSSDTDLGVSSLRKETELGGNPDRIAPAGLFSGFSRKKIPFDSMHDIVGNSFLDNFGIPLLGPLNEGGSDSFSSLGFDYLMNASSDQEAKSILPPGLFPSSK